MRSPALCSSSLLLILAASLLSACSRPAVDTTEVVRPVRVMEVALEGTESTESFAAQIEPRFSAQLSFQVGGKLVARLVDVGDRVKKGQVLARIDPQDLKLGVQAAQAGLDTATKEFQQARVDLDRFKALFEQNFISQAEFGRRTLAFEAAQSRYTQAKAQFSAQSNQNQYSELRAPNDGVIAQVLLDAGQVVAPGQPVLQWAQESAIQARIAVPERKVSGLSIGQQAKLVLWSGKEPLTAKIRDIAPLADPVTRTFAVLLDVNDPAHQVRLGMSATVHFNTEGQGQAFKLPIASLVASHTGAYVWVFDEQAGTVAKRVLTPYDVSDSTFLVKEGLKPGELVVTAGTHVLNEGQKVRRFIETQDLVKQAVKP